MTLSTLHAICQRRLQAQGQHQGLGKCTELVFFFLVGNCKVALKNKWVQSGVKDREQ